MFIYLHILLEAAVYAEFTLEVFGFCREMDTTLTSLSLPYVLLAIKSCFFCLCIRTDPGLLQFHLQVFRLKPEPGLIQLMLSGSVGEEKSYYF